MKKKILSMALACLMVATAVVTLAACGGKKDGIEFYIYGQSHERSIYGTMVDKFVEETGIKVIKKFVPSDGYKDYLSSSLGTKNAPDVFYVNPTDASFYANNGAILDMSSYLEAEKDAGGYDYNDYTDGVIDYYRYDTTTKKRGEGDAIWAVPKDVSSYPLAYNKVIIDLSASTYPVDGNGNAELVTYWEKYTKTGDWAARSGGMPKPWENDPATGEQIVYTFEEFSNACKACSFTSGGKKYFGTALIDTWSMHSWIWAAGGNWLSEDGKTVTVNTPEFKAGLREFVELMDYRGVSQTRAEMASKPHYDRWMEGQVAFFNVGVWDVAAFEGVSKTILNYGLMPTPRKDKQTGSTWYTYIGTLGFAVSSNCKDPASAIKLAMYMGLSNESYTRMTEKQTIQLPNSREKFAEYFADTTIPPLNKRVYIEAITEGHGKLHPSAMAYTAIWYDRFIDELSKVWKENDTDTAGEMTPEEYCAYIQPIMQTQLNYALADENL